MHIFPPDRIIAKKVFRTQKGVFYRASFFMDMKNTIFLKNLQTMNIVWIKPLKNGIGRLYIAGLPDSLQLPEECLRICHVFKNMRRDDKIKCLILEWHFRCVAKNHWPIYHHQFPTS